MASKTNFNVTPYWDDFEPDNNFYKILFRPGFAVQARELTSIQSILQNQIEQFGNHIFKEGSIVIPGSVGYDSSWFSLKLNPTFSQNTVSTYLSEFVGTTITGDISGVTAKVVGYDLSDSASGDPDVLYVKYVTTSIIDNSTITFTSGENISSDAMIAALEPNAISATTASTAANHTGSAVKVLDGVYFIRGFMVKNLEQTIVLDKFSNTPSYRVGWDIIETFVTPEEDSSLLDNAQGSSNYAAKGAHRLKIELILVKKSLDDVDDGNFVELIRIKEGVIERRIKYTEYSIISDMLARRTDEESGNYIVNHFDMEVRENLSDGTNRGIYTSNNNGKEDKETIVISPGKAYVNGYEVDIQSASFVNINKARAIKNVQNTSISAGLGNFAKVTNIYGQPDITKGTDLDPFGIVKLYSTLTVTRGQPSGSHVGYARSRGFEHNSGNAGDNTAVYHHYLFDIAMFNNIHVDIPVTVSTNSVITGVSSGSYGIVVTGVSSASSFTVMQQHGDFLRGETLISSVASDQLSTATIQPLTNNSAEKKSFGRDVKQINMDKASGLDYTADILLSDSKTVAGASAGTVHAGLYRSPRGLWDTLFDLADIFFSDSTLLGGVIDAVGTTISGFNTEFLGDVVEGDILSIATGTSGQQEMVTVTSVNDNNNITLDTPVTNDTSKISITRLRTSIREIEETISVYELPKDNVKTLLNDQGQVDTRYSFRQQYVSISDAGGVVTFDLPPGYTWESTNVARNYVLTVIGSPGGSVPVGSVINIYDQSIGVETSGTRLTITDPNGIGAGTQLELMATVGVAVSRHRTKTIQKMIQKNIGYDSLSNIYGERPSDKLISLSYADVHKLHAVYVSSNSDDDAIMPSLSIGDATGAFQAGEIILGSISGGAARVIRDSGQVVNYVEVSGQITTLDVITGEESGVTARVLESNTGDRNIISSFTLDTGQRDSYYDIGRLVRRPGFQIPQGKLLVIYDYFTSGTGDYFSVDSYNDQVPYDEIPYYSASRIDTEITGPNGNYALADSLDFRPRIADQNNPTVSPFAYTNKNFSDVGSISGNVVEPDSLITTDFDFYLGRRDLIYLNSLGLWSIVEGVPAEYPIWPASDNIDMLVGRIDVPPFTFQPEDVILDYVNNKGFTMRDISKLETRIANLEYSTTLGLLERETDSYMILDSSGMNRFKSGFIVDNFYGHNVGNSTHHDYEIAVDPSRGHLRPVGVQTGVNLIEEETSDGGRSSLAYQKTGDIITLKYTEADEIVQPYASRVESVNPYFVTHWIGHLQLLPETDVWMDDDRIPALTVNVEGNYEQLLREQSEAGALGTVWNSWNTVWTGNASGGSSSQRQVNPDGSGAERNLIRWVTSESSSIDVRQERTGMNTRLVERIDNISAGDRVTNIEVVPWIRARDVNFLVTGMKPNTQVYSFFDSVDVNADVKPIARSATETNTEANLLNSGTTMQVVSTDGFPSTGTLGIGDTQEIDPFGIGFIKQEQMTYTGKTSTSFTGITRNTGNQFDEPQNWLAGTPVTDQNYGNPLITDSIGQLEGRFKIPNSDSKRFRIGKRMFRLTDSADNSQIAGFVNTSADKEYLAIGHKQTKQELIMATRNATITQVAMQDTRSFTESSSSTNVGAWYDPLAQSIMCDKEGGMFITSVDIFFSHRDEALPVWVEIRTMINGYPSQVILPFSVKYLKPNEVSLNTVDGTTPTTFTFESPVYLTDGVEYCIVVASDSPEYKIWISRLGELDIGGTRAISTQPHLGSLFKSQNASTWTASQYEDMKFTLKRAVFDTANTGLFTVVNEAFTVDEIASGGGNGLIPQLKENPIESVIGEDKVKIKFINHMNHDVLNAVEVKGVISDVNPTYLSTAISNQDTALTVVDTSNFPTSGTIRIENEIITYSGISGNQLIGCERGKANSNDINTIKIGHESGTLVNLHMFAGIPLIEINKVHIRIEDPELDSFLIPTTTSATVTTMGGGSNVYATKNISYDVVQPVIQTMEFSSTKITAQLQTTSGTTIGNLSQPSFERKGTSSAVDVPLNEDTYFDQPSIICSSTNELENLAGNKSFRLNMKLSTMKDNVSPFIDTQRMLAICVSSRLNNINEPVNGIYDVNTTFTEYSPMTNAEGDNNSSIYITKKITLANSATALKVYFDAVKMTGSNIKVLYKIQRLDQSSPFEFLPWTLFTGSSGEPTGLSDPPVSTSKNIGDFKEHQYLAGKKVNGLGQSLDQFNAFAIKIVMQGINSSTPPIVKDFRAIALAT